MLPQLHCSEVETWWASLRTAEAWSKRYKRIKTLFKITMKTAIIFPPEAAKKIWTASQDKWAGNPVRRLKPEMIDIRQMVNVDLQSAFASGLRQRISGEIAIFLEVEMFDKFTKEMKTITSPQPRTSKRKHDEVMTLYREKHQGLWIKRFFFFVRQMERCNTIWHLRWLHERFQSLRSRST